MADKYLSVSEVAAQCDVHPRTVRRWLDRGWLPFLQLPSGKRMVDRQHVDGLLSTEVQEAGGKPAARYRSPRFAAAWTAGPRAPAWDALWREILKSIADDFAPVEDPAASGDNGERQSGTTGGAA